MAHYEVYAEVNRYKLGRFLRFAGEGNLEWAQIVTEKYGIEERDVRM